MTCISLLISHVQTKLRSRDLGLGPEGSGVAAELAAAKSTIDNLRAEIAQFRLKPASVGPVAYGNSRKACGSFRHNSSNAGNDRQPRQGDWASEGADRRKTGSRTNVADDKTGTDASAGAEREALLDYVQVSQLLMGFGQSRDGYRCCTL